MLDVDIRERIANIIAKSINSKNEIKGANELVEFINEIIKDAVLEGCKGNYGYALYRLKDLEEALVSLVLSPEVVYRAQDFMEVVLSNPNIYITTVSDIIGDTIAVSHIQGILLIIQALREAFRKLMHDKSSEEI